VPQSRGEMGVRPGSALEQALAVLTRPDRRLLLASLQARGGKRRAKLKKQAERRLRQVGVL